MKRGRMDDRRCGTCTRGRFERDGEAADGRPRYRCSACGDTHTAGHRGHEWDDMPGPGVGSCTCTGCEHRQAIALREIPPRR